MREAFADEKLDLLFLVAGISGSVPKPLHEVSPDEAARVFLINAYFPIAAAEAFADLLKPKATVAFMSSSSAASRKTTTARGRPIGMSKAALNMGARSFFHRHRRTCGALDRARLGAHRHGRAVGDVRRRDELPQCRERDREARQKPGHRYVNYDGTELPW